MHGDDEIQSGQNGRKSEDEHADQDRQHLRRCRRRIRSIKSPTGVRAAVDHAVDRDRRSRQVQVERREVDPGKGDVARADHQRQHEVAERRRNRRDEEEEDHHDAVQREEPVVAERVHQERPWLEQLHSQRQREDAAEKEGGDHRDQEHHADALMVARVQPRHHRRAVGQVARRRRRSGEPGAIGFGQAHRQVLPTVRCGPRRSAAT